jgi:hypothetical protein
MKVARLACLILAISVGCKDEDSIAYSSLEGEWNYVTADKKLSLSFKLSLNSGSEYRIDNVTLEYDGKKYSPSETGQFVSYGYISKGSNYPSAFDTFDFQPTDGGADYTISLQLITPNKLYNEMAVVKGYYLFQENGQQLFGEISPSKITRK